MAQTMRAIVCTKPGGPSVLKLDKAYPKPQPKLDYVLIQIKAVGLNRAELRSRAGDPPAKSEFISDDLYTTNPPKILGEECVGVVANTGGCSTVAKGDTVATYFCGIGKVFDGSYAEYTLAPARYVYKLDTSLPWQILGGLPATLMTAYGSLQLALHVHRGETILVHGGTSSVGVAAIMLAKLTSCKVAATTRQPNKADMLRSFGADIVLIDKDDGSLAGELRQHPSFEDGAEHVLELVGPDKLPVAFACAKRFGTVCVTGILSKCWTLENWTPADGIESGKKLTTFQCPRDALQADHHAQVQAMVKNVDLGNFDAKRLIARTLYGLESIIEAHELMESNEVSGKIVVML